MCSYAPSSSGYARLQFAHEGVTYSLLAHRVAWARANGPIPDGLVIHHECFARRCVNPEHLRATEMFQNTRRTGGQDWPEGTCKYGHPDSQMVRVARTKRRCGPCLRAERRRADLRHRQKKRGVGTC